MQPVSAGDIQKVECCCRAPVWLLIGRSTRGVSDERIIASVVAGLAFNKT